MRSAAQRASAMNAIRQAELQRHGKGSPGIDNPVPVGYHARLTPFFDADIFHLQQVLIEDGYKVELTGVMDEETFTALEEYLEEL
jgi:hypothetical protein